MAGFPSGWGPSSSTRGGGLDENRVEGARPPRRPHLHRERTGPGARRGLRREPPALTPRLDWVRRYKDDYEVHCLGREVYVLGREATTSARGFPQPAHPELEIHQAFVQPSARDAQLPYTTIVASTRRARPFHFREQADGGPRPAVLFNAGAPGAALRLRHARRHPPPAIVPLAALVAAMIALEQELAHAAHPGRPYLDLHLQARRHGPDPLRAAPRAGLRGGGLREGLHFTLLPPRSRAPPRDPGTRRGRPAVRPLGHPGPAAEGAPFHLRNTRTIEPGHVYTIEPGIYAVPDVLRPFRSGSDAAAFDWESIGALTALGGVRIKAATSPSPARATSRASACAD